MAIIWVDPYIDSANGGIHGTTGSGSGTYASPYGWWDLNGYNALGSSNVFNEGDEIRFKGLTESSFFGSLQSWSSVTQNGGLDSQWNLPSGTDQMLKVISRYDNNKELYIYQNPGYSYLYSLNQQGTWHAPLPMLDNSGYYIFNSNYQISNPNARNTTIGHLPAAMFNYGATTTTNPVRVTAGWTSETQQGGITFLCMAPNYQIAWGHTGVQVGEGYGHMVVDCLDTLVLGFGDNEDAYINAIELNLKAVCGANYNSSDYISFGIGFTSNPNNIDYTAQSFTPGTLKMDQIVTGSYSQLYSYAPRSAGNVLEPEIYINTLVKGYYTWDLYLRHNNSSSASDDPEWTVRLRKVFLHYGANWNGQYSNNKAKVNLIFENDFEWLQAANQPWNFNNTIEVLSETLGTDDATNNPQYPDRYYLRTDGGGNVATSYISTAPLERSLTDANKYSIYSNSSSILKKASPSGYLGEWYNEYIIENQGETIDTVSSSPAVMNPGSFNSSYIKNSCGIGKIYVAYESTSNNAVSLIPIQYTGTFASAPVAIEYKSPSTFSGKTCWRLFGSANGYSYSQLYRIPLPNFGSATSDYTFETFFNTTASPGVDISIVLWVYGLSSGLTTFRTLTPTVSGTTISFSETISPAELKVNLVSQIFAEVIMSKTSTANCSVAFNNFSLT